MKRREFLNKTALASTIPLVLGGFNISKSSPIFEYLANASQDEDKILVIIQLNGGNDGLNTVIPLEYYSQLFKARQNIIVPENSVLKYNEKVGLHPSLKEIDNLSKEGKLLTIQNVGYPEPNFSHFRSTDVWTSGSASDKYVQSGWIGRLLDKKYPEYPKNYPNNNMPDPLSITIGGTLSMTCQGPIYNMGLVVKNTTNFYEMRTNGEDIAPNTNAGQQLEFLRTIASKTKVYTQTIKTASEKGKNLSTLYPAANSNKLADQLKIIAQLINGGLKTRVYVASINGFDTHAGQVEEKGNTDGVHSYLLKSISVAVNAFQDDLKLMKKEDKVVGMTFSEFGRRIIANDSFGTDHGAAAPLFFFGTEIQSGFLGDNPIIPENAVVDTNVPMQFDFRDIYMNILVDWFNLSIAEAESLMFKEFRYLPIFKQANTSINNQCSNSDISIGYNFPNPFDYSTSFKYKVNEGRVKLSLYDYRGYELYLILDDYKTKGEYEQTIYSNNLNSGVYYLKLENNHQSKMNLITVMK